MQRLFLSKSFVYGYLLDAHIFFLAQHEMKATTHILLAIAITFATIVVHAQESNDTLRILITDAEASIIPPKHFEYDSLTNRIVHVGTMSQIQVSKVTNRPYNRIAAAITKEYMASQGFELIDKQNYKMQSGHDATIFRSRFLSKDENSNDMYFIRLMLFTGSKNTIWVTADFPECISKQIEEAVRNSMLSAKERE